MLKKIINKIIMGTKCYLSLREHTNNVESLLENTQTQLKGNKTTARKIIRLVNSLLKKDEIVPTQKEIKALCNEIIKGE